MTSLVNKGAIDIAVYAALENAKKSGPLTVDENAQLRASIPSEAYDLAVATLGAL